MRRVKRVIVMLTVLFVALLVMAFVLENQQDVSLSFMGFATGKMPVSMFVVGALVAGMLIGPLFGFLIRNRRLRSVYDGRS